MGGGGEVSTGRGFHLSAVLLVVSCASTDSRANGSLEAVWTGAETGAVSAPAFAQWCPGRRFAEVLGITGDTGVAVAIRDVDSIAPGRYAAVLPDSADTTAPSATVALRFLSRTSITGYQSDSGAVTLVRAPDGSLRLEFQVRAKPPAAAARITLRGNAEGLPVREGGFDCAAGQRGE
jgi:hypothetical protein